VGPEVAGYIIAEQHIGDAVPGAHDDEIAVVMPAVVR
jgi:hypothetical protein